MAFDERGQADNFQRKKIDICARAYDLLIKQAAFFPSDIIFDPEHPDDRDRLGGAPQYAIVSLKQRAGLQTSLAGPCVSAVGSAHFVFVSRNNNVREAMHTAFLFMRSRGPGHGDH